MINNKKNAVVLLITLLFIMSISVLILKNLDDSNKFIDEVSYDTTLTQVKITKENVEDEVKRLVNRYKDNIDELLEISSGGIPLEYGNIKIIITLMEYNNKQCNINNINNIDDLYEKCDNNIVSNILYPYDLVQTIIKYRLNTIVNNQQKDFILNKYILKTQDNYILKVKDGFSYIDNKNKILECRYIILINKYKFYNTFLINN
jgi:hypothetical protein